MAGFQLTETQRDYSARLRSLATESLLPLVEGGVEGRVNRPLLLAMGKLGLLRDLFGSGTAGSVADGDEPPRVAAAMQLCLLRESLAQVSGEAETALALQGLGSYPDHPGWAGGNRPAVDPAGHLGRGGRRLRALRGAGRIGCRRPHAPSRGATATGGA